jgi:putative transposase
MIILLAHKIALDPNRAQSLYFARACGVARFAYNWALAEWRKQYRAGDKPNEVRLRRQLNSIKREQFPWMLEVSKTAPQQAIKNVGIAYKNFFEDLGKYRRGEIKNQAIRRPDWKRKGKSTDSFRADNGPGKADPNAVAVLGQRVKLPVIGWVRMHEALRFKGQIKSATVSRVADRWFVSLSVEMDHTPSARENQAVAGVDLGVKVMATVSDGSTFGGPKALRRNLKRLKRMSRALSRKKKGSANRNKARRKLARLHARIANIRRDTLHKVTTSLVRRFSSIGIEDLNIRGMLSNRKLARAIADVGAYEFRRQLAYKAEMYGTGIVVADRWFPSSKRCSDCRWINADLTLSERKWACEGCGVVHDRDRNAAINLKLAAESSLAACASLPDVSGCSVTVCGAASADARHQLSVKLAVVKQKPTHETFVHA